MENAAGGAVHAGAGIGNIDPDVVRFVARVNADHARLTGGHELPPTEMRKIAEEVRTPWSKTGPAMQHITEYVADTGAGTVPLRMYDPGVTRPSPVLVYLHGGGWTSFSIDTHDRVMREYATLPAPRWREFSAPIGTLLSPRFLPATVLLALACLAQITVFYFVQKWIPKIVVDRGHTAAEAGMVLVFANAGFFAGALLTACYPLAAVAPVMGSGASVAALMLVLLSRTAASPRS